MISAVRLAGPIRSSLLWRLTHRRLFLLNTAWIAEYYERPASCLLCESQQAETYSHLFSDCTLATRLWDSTLPLQQQLGGGGGDQRPARLLGELAQFKRQWSDHWPGGGPPPPKPEKITMLVREMWTEVRAVVLWSLWRARCDLLHDNVARKKRPPRHSHVCIQLSAL